MQTAEVEDIDQIGATQTIGVVFDNQVTRILVAVDSPFHAMAGYQAPD